MKQQQGLKIPRAYIIKGGRYSVVKEGGNRNMPDVPWHIGYAKKEDDDPRRHKARCIHYEKGKCYYKPSREYGKRCMGSSHCDYYSETYDYTSEIDESVNEKKSRERADEYHQKYIDRKNKLAKDDTFRIDQVLRGGSKCPICGSLLTKRTKTLLKCSLCEAFFDAEKNRDKKHSPDIIDSGLFYYPQQEKPKNKKHQGTTIVVNTICRFQKNKLCKNPDSKHYNYKCKLGICNEYKYGL